MRLATVTLLSMIAFACGGDVSGHPEASPDVMAAAMHELVAVNHTFGDGPPPFTDYLIQEQLDPTAGTAS